MRRALLLLTIVAGCSFPEATFSDEVPDARVDTAVASDTSADAPVDASDTSPRDVADTNVGPDPCDKDKDGVKAKGDPCGGTDCDDNDPNARPGITEFQTFDATGKPHGGDWNCDGDIEKQYKVDVSCGLLGGAACGMTKGFTSNPGCGKTGEYVQCSTSGTFCVPGTPKTETQGCR